MQSLCGETQKNQPELYNQVEILFGEVGEPDFVMVEKGHGRLEQREIWASQELVGYSDFPGLNQALMIKKRVEETIVRRR